MVRLFVHFLNEIEKHDDVADDDSNQACNSQKRHEAEWRAHHGKADQCPGHAVWSRGKHEEWFNGISELQEQRAVDSEKRDRQYLRQICKTGLLLRPFA